MGTNGYIDKQAILSHTRLPEEELEIPEWEGKKVRVRGLTAGQRDAWELGIRNDKDEGRSQIRARLVAMALVDEDGQRLFSDKEVALLSAISARPIDRIFFLASRLSGLGKEDIEEIEKNLKAPPQEDSSSL